MGFFDKVRDTFRDHTRENLCAGLQMLGINAQIATRGGFLEGIERGIYSKSLGLIDIPEGPIGWVNVIKKTVRESTTYYTKYAVPDHRLQRNSPEVRINSVRMRTFPLVGEVVDLHWKGKDFGLGIIGRLSNDVQLRQPIMRSRDVRISAHGQYRCWIMSAETCEAPSQELWSCYQAIARHLLAEWSLGQ